MCLERGKLWEGATPKCYFDNPQDNWMCALVTAVRHLCPPYEEPRSGIHSEYCDDDWYAVIKTDDIWEGELWDKEDLSRCLYIAWYKDRGHTETLWFLGSGSFIPRIPTEEELLAILGHYKNKETK